MPELLLMVHWWWSAWAEHSSALWQPWCCSCAGYSRAGYAYYSGCYQHNYQNTPYTIPVLCLVCSCSRFWWSAWAEHSSALWQPWYCSWVGHNRPAGAYSSLLSAHSSTLCVMLETLFTSSGLLRTDPSRYTCLMVAFQHFSVRYHH